MDPWNSSWYYSFQISWPYPEPIYIFPYLWLLYPFSKWMLGFDWLIDASIARRGPRLGFEYRLRYLILGFRQCAFRLIWRDRLRNLCFRLLWIGIVLGLLLVWILVARLLNRESPCRILVVGYDRPVIRPSSHIFSLLFVDEGLTLRFSKKFQTPGSTSKEFNQSVNTLASLSPSASKSSISGGASASSSGASPGWLLNKLATKARLSLGFPPTSEFGVRNRRHPILSALSRTCSARWCRSEVWRGALEHCSGLSWFRRMV